MLAAAHVGQRLKIAIRAKNGRFEIANAGFQERTNVNTVTVYEYIKCIFLSALSIVVFKQKTLDQRLTCLMYSQAFRCFVQSFLNGSLAV